MGLFSLTQTASTPLTPFHPPLGVNPHYCVPVVTTLVLKVSSLSASPLSFELTVLEMARLVSNPP